MLLGEANARLKTKKLTVDELEQINALYILLDMDKTEFCKIVDCVGFEVLAKKQDYFQKALSALDYVRAKERHERDLDELEQIERRLLELKERAAAYQ